MNQVNLFGCKVNYFVKFFLILPTEACWPVTHIHFAVIQSAGAIAPVIMATGHKPSECFAKH